MPMGDNPLKKSPPLPFLLGVRILSLLWKPEGKLPFPLWLLQAIGPPTILAGWASARAPTRLHTPARGNGRTRWRLWRRGEIRPPGLLHQNGRFCGLHLSPVSPCSYRWLAADLQSVCSCVRYSFCEIRLPCCPLFSTHCACSIIGENGYWGVMAQKTGLRTWGGS